MDDDTRWLTPDELRAWTRLEAVVELLPGALDGPLRHAAELSHYEYLVLAKLSEAPERTLRMSELAARTNATLPRLSHVSARLEARGYLERRTCADDRRATLASLTDAGWRKVLATAPEHVRSVRDLVIDALTPEQVAQLDAIATAVLCRLDPEDHLRMLGPAPTTAV
ncbi:MAG TPA: MarR family transcriptional regulator [Cellulomonas sp.]|uniref:MarR family winged helix-turn-helix transcriptional regulator n=1 Tax=Cellulomonas sp. TaxID=40001 RepID=UPI002E37DF53|nr:MarR family transcriptional regulator [Cellulomonas sp.]HEX5333709.1 MarR family transcriptional regulator [Cellulomonas sp.]